MNDDEDEYVDGGDADAYRWASSLLDYHCCYQNGNVYHLTVVVVVVVLMMQLQMMFEVNHLSVLL